MWGLGTELNDGLDATVTLYSVEMMLMEKVGLDVIRAVFGHDLDDVGKEKCFHAHFRLYNAVEAKVLAESVWLLAGVGEFVTG